MSHAFGISNPDTLPAQSGRQDFVAPGAGFFASGSLPIVCDSFEPATAPAFRLVDIGLSGQAASTSRSNQNSAQIVTDRGFEKTPFTALTPPSYAHASQIVELFKEAYQGRYPNPRLANPQHVQQDIEDGKFILVAAIDRNNSVLGFGGLTDISEEHVKVGLSGTVYELGKLVVGSASQGFGLGTELLAARIELAGRLGVDALISFAVTSHDYSQRSLGKHGFQPSGIHLCDWPVILKDDQRESAVAMHLFLNPAAITERTVHVHEAVQKPLELAYRTLGCSRTLQVGRTDQTDESPQAFRHDVDASDIDQSAVLLFTSAAPRSGDRIDTHAFFSAGYQHVSAKINLMHPAATSQIETLAQSGFRFASVQPLPNGDLLTMQAPRTIPGDIRTALKLSHQTSRDLLYSILAN